MKKVLNFGFIFLENEIQKENKKVKSFLLDIFFQTTYKNNVFLQESNAQIKFENIIKTNLSNIDDALETSDKILCWGDVQSGKTNNIIAMSLYFSDNGYDIVIILGGTNNILYNQTNKRFEELNFNEIKGMSYLNKQKLAGISISNVVESDRKIIINAMKDDHNISSLLDNLGSADLANKKIMVIDDESDWGSINTSSKKEGGTSIFNKIINLFERAKGSKLVSVTATPYANIISKKSSTLKPDVIIKLICDDKYTGNDFFSKHNTYELVDVSKKDLLSNKSKINDEHFIKIVKQGLKWYFYSSALCEYLINEKQKFELLFNVDLSVNTHLRIAKVVEREIKRIKNLIDSNFIKNYFRDQISYYERMINLQDSHNNFHSILKKIINNTNLIQLNSENNEAQQYKSGEKKSVVIIGGTMTSRGFTFENLMTQVMINAPENKISADTLLQRCRWFGYRTFNNRFKFMKIIMNKTISKALNEVRILDELIMREKKVKNTIIINDKLVDTIKKYNFKIIKPTSEGKS